jgi:hypothetical protein
MRRTRRRCCRVNSNSKCSTSKTTSFRIKRRMRRRSMQLYSLSYNTILMPFMIKGLEAIISNF